MSYLISQSNRVVITAIVQFEPQIGFVGNLPRVAEAILQHRKFPHWQSNAQSYLLRDPGARLLLHLDHTRAQFQILGFAAWHDAIAELSGVARLVLDGYSLRQVKRFSLKVAAYLDLEMTFDEMINLMFGSFLLPRQSCEALLGPPRDSTVILVGEQDGMDVTLHASPMNREQIDETCFAIPNLELFSESRFRGSAPEEFRDGITDNCFYVDVTAVKKELDAYDLEREMNAATRIAGDVIDKAVSLLKSLPAQREIYEANS